MRAKLYVAISILLALMLAAGLQPCKAEPQKTLLQELELPQYPGTKLLTEINLPAGKLLDSIEEEFGPWLGLADLKQVTFVNCSVDSSVTAEQVLKFYEPILAESKWNFVLRSLDIANSIAILSNEKKGLLIVTMDPPNKKDRQITLMRLTAKLDPEKVANPSGKLPAMLSGMVVKAASKIPVGQPIPVPPAESLHIKATRSEIKARILDQNMAELRLGFGADDPGKLARDEDALVMTFTPKVDVESLTLPGTVPLLLELTESPLTLTGGKRPNDRPVKLIVISTGAPVMLEAYPLISGTNTLNVEGGDVQASLSDVQGGTLEIEVNRGDLTLSLPKNASAQVEISAPSAKTTNQTGVEPQKTSATSMSLLLGSGKAAISLKATNGTVCVKTNN